VYRRADASANGHSLINEPALWRADLNAPVGTRAMAESRARMEIEIRDERSEDFPAVRVLNEQAFGQDQEANIVDALRTNGAVRLSLVATRAGQVVGHILYSPITIGGALEGAALGPMSVSPHFQRQGIGSRLVRAGNARLEQAGVPYIIVLGHADYYPRFGFKPASQFGVSCEWSVTDDVFMLLVFDPTRMRGVSGRAQYRPEFSAVG
jgi:putative acetyltransferase